MKRRSVVAPRDEAMERLQDTIDKQMDWLKSYKSRQDAIVLGLGDVNRALEAGYYPAAKDALDEILTGSLKQAKDRVDNLLLALSIAVKTIEDGMNTPASRDALSQIELMAPAEFRAVTVEGAS